MMTSALTMVFCKPHFHCTIQYALSMKFRDKVAQSVSKICISLFKTQ